MKSKVFIYIMVFIFSGCYDKNSSEIKTKDENSYEIKTRQENIIETLVFNAKNKKTDVNFRLENAEKAFELLDKRQNNIFKRKKLTSISLVYLALNKKNDFKKVIDESIYTSKKINDSSGTALNYNNYAVFYKKHNLLDSAYFYHNKAKKIYSNLKKKIPYQYGKSLLGMAIIDRQSKDYTRSISTTIKAIEQFQLNGNAHNYLAISYSNLGIVCNNIEEFDKAIEYHTKSIESSINLKKREEREVLAYNNIGIVYKNQKKYLDAIRYFKKALNYTNYLKKNPKRKSLLLDNLAYVNFLNGSRKDILNDFLEPLKIRDSIGDKTGLTTSQLHLSEYYYSVKELDSSFFYAKKVEGLSRKLKANKELLQSYLLLSKIRREKGGLKYAEKYIILSDSLAKEERLFRDKFARIRFETKEKEDQIKQGEKQIKQGEQQIIEVQNQNAIYLLGILLLLTGIGFAVFFFRQRTRYLSQQNKIVQFQAAYETETRISKRLHDELGNDIFQVMLQYQNDPKDPHITEKLNTAYTKARDISRENNDFEVDETYPEEVSNMLQNYTQNGIQLILRGFDTMYWGDTDKTIKITVYRVLQELMTNMQKHSNASIVAIVFSNSNNTLNIKYSDNGSGISQTQLLSKNGLRNTEKRIQAVHGTIIFDSEKDKGFKAEIKIPS